MVKFSNSGFLISIISNDFSDIDVFIFVSDIISSNEMEILFQWYCETRGDGEIYIYNK